jgi:hypothetical protein
MTGSGGEHGFADAVSLGGVGDGDPVGDEDCNHNTEDWVTS